MEIPKCKFPFAGLEGCAAKQQNYAGQLGVTFYEKTPPKTETVIGSWYLDKFGNPMREIKAPNLAHMRVASSKILKNISMHKIGLA